MSSSARVASATSRMGKSRAMTWSDRSDSASMHLRVDQQRDDQQGGTAHDQAVEDQEHQPLGPAPPPAGISRSPKHREQQRDGDAHLAQGERSSRGRCRERRSRRSHHAERGRGDQQDPGRRRRPCVRAAERPPPTMVAAAPSTGRPRSRPPVSGVQRSLVSRTAKRPPTTNAAASAILNRRRGAETRAGAHDVGNLLARLYFIRQKSLCPDMSVSRNEASTGRSRRRAPPRGTSGRRRSSPERR